MPRKMIGIGFGAFSTTFPTAPVPPDPADGIPLTITRLDETTSGSVLVSNGIPLLAGAYTKTKADANKGVVTVGGVERAAYVCGLGRHPDGSYRAVLVQFIANPTTESSAAFNPDDVRATTDRTFESVPPWDAVTKLPAARVLADPTKAGQPAACALPTDAAYLCATNFTGPGLVTRTQAAAVANVGSYLEVTDDRFDYWQRDTHLYGAHAGNATPFQDINITLFPDADAYSAGQPVGWTGETPPPYYDWRTALAQYGGSQTHHHSYDAPRTFFEMWCRTGDLSYWRLGMAISWSQMYHDRWAIGTTTIDRWSNYGGYTSRSPEGMGCYLLATGEREALDWWTLVFNLNSKGMAFQYWRNYGDPANPVANDSLQVGAFDQYAGEPRISGRTLVGRYWAWKITRPEAESNPRCGEQINPLDGDGYIISRDMVAILNHGLTRVLDGTARLANGLWTTGLDDYAVCNSSPASAPAINTFMCTIVLDALIKVYEDGPTTLTDRADIAAAVQLAAQTLYDDYFGDWDGATSNSYFKNWFGGFACTGPSTWGVGYPTSDITGMYVLPYAWLAYHLDSAPWKAKAEEVLVAAVGGGTVSTQVDGLAGPVPYYIKQCHEHFVYIQPVSGWLHKAGL